MTKILYTENGIYSYCEGHIKNAKSSLTSAQSIASSFDIPSYFSMKGYLSSLGSKIGEFIGELNSLDSKLNTVSNYYEDVTMRMTDEVNQLDTSVINEREKLIL